MKFIGRKNELNALEREYRRKSGFDSRLTELSDNNENLYLFDFNVPAVQDENF